MCGRWIDRQCLAQRRIVRFFSPPLPWAEVLLTLDRGDFASVMGTNFYGLEVLTPGDFLERERAAGRLSDA
jgi:hypothetical protein